jgi:hypothetical protein
MKKAIFLVFILAGASQLKAQQISPKPTDPLLFKAPADMGLKQFNLKDSALFIPFKFDLKNNQLAVLSGIKNADLTAVPFNSRMPVLKVTSDDKMPVAKVQSDDNMPVLKVKPVDPLAVVVKPIP